MTDVKRTIKEGVVIIENREAFNELLKTDKEKALKLLAKDSGVYYDYAEIGKQKYQVFDKVNTMLFQEEQTTNLATDHSVFFLCDVVMGNVGIRRTDFLYWYFLGNANFTKATFSNKANFLEATFSGPVNFLEATFSNQANFFNTSFFDQVAFERATFSGEASFWGSTFFSSANFVGTTFSRQAYFMGATFSGEAAFENATFSGEADFRNATFHGIVDFQGELFAEEATVSFGPTVFEKPELALFQGVNLARCSFLGANISRVDFTGVTWGDAKKIPRHQNKFVNSWKGFFAPSRNIIYDETQACEGEVKPVLVEKLYRQLKVNYETKKDFDRAGDFYYGEMEMKRKGKKWGATRVANWIYKILSGYGEIPGLALLWFGFLLVIFSSAYLWAGFASVNPDLHIEANFKQSLFHFFEVATFQRARRYKVISDVGGWIEVAQTILIPLQVALVALAFKRKFKR